MSAFSIRAFKSLAFIGLLSWLGCPVSVPNSDSLQYACSQTADCPQGQSCVDGLCLDQQDAGATVVDPGYTDAGLAEAGLVDSARTDHGAADLLMTDLEDQDSTLADVNLVDVNLADVNFADAEQADVNFADVNFADVNFADANLADVNLADVNFADVNLADVNFADVNLADVNLADANLADANLADVNLADVNLADVNLADANLADANLPDTFSPALQFIWTSQEDFSNNGGANQIDLESSPGDVILLWQQFSTTSRIEATNRDAWDDENNFRRDLCYFSNASWNDFAGLQWPLATPQGVTIDNAYMNLFVVGHDSGAPSDVDEACPAYQVEIKVQDLVNPDAFANWQPVTSDDRSYWAEAATWDIPSGGLGLGWKQSPDLTKLVQHLIDQPEWTRNSHIGFIIGPFGNAVGYGCSENLHDFSDGEGPLLSQLVVSYSAFPSLGELRSKVVDSHANDSQWHNFSVTANQPLGTDLLIQVRASNDLFSADAIDPGWESLPTLPSDQIATGRYFQWRMALRSSSQVDTPTLQEVQVEAITP